MYHRRIMDYFNKQDNRGIVPNATWACERSNPSCGDEISFTGRIQKGAIVDLKYEGAGCIISQATASLLCDYARGKRLEELQGLTPDALLSLLELKLGPNRMQCIELPLETLQDAVTHAQ